MNLRLPAFSDRGGGIGFFRIQLHDGMGGCGGAGEKVEDKGISFCPHLQ